MNSLGYRPALDGLRGVAILTVVGRHAGLLSGGFLGVDIFFALSGFLITTLLVDEYAATGGIALGRFYARRALRLLPAMVLMVLVAQTYLWAMMPSGYLALRVQQAAAVLFYVGNYSWLFGLPGLGYLGHAWSLASEEQFYLLWPLALFGLLRVVRVRGVVTGVVAAAAIGAVLWRAVVVAGGPGGGGDLYQRLDTHGDPILIGCAAALVVSWGHFGQKRAWMLGLGGVAGAVTLAVLTVRSTWPRDFLAYHVSALAGLATALVLVDVIVRPRGVLSQLLELRPLRELGRISYGVYLWHFPVFYAWGAMAPVRPYGVAPGGPGRIALAAVSTLAIAVASYLWVERPALKLKARFASVKPRPIKDVVARTPAVSMSRV